jgi:hypothetical protein
MFNQPKKNTEDMFNAMSEIPKKNKRMLTASVFLITIGLRPKLSLSIKRTPTPKK